MAKTGERCRGIMRVDVKGGIKSSYGVGIPGNETGPFVKVPYGIPLTLRLRFQLGAKA